MDESWRFRPMADHHKPCPVCSISHYPFCRPPSALAGDNVRFLPSDFCPPLFHRPFHNPSFPIESAFLRPPSQQFPVIHEEIVDRESFPKRMRVDGTAIGVFPSSRPLNRVLSVDDERRLNLIRDHGREGSTQVQDDCQWNYNNIDNRMDRDRYNTLQKYHGSGRADYGLLESKFCHRDDRYEAVGFEEGCQNQPVSNLDREGRRDFDRMDIGFNRRGVLDSQIEGNYSYGHSDQIDRNSQVYQFCGSDEVLGTSQNFVSDVLGDSCSKESRRPSSYTTNDNSISRVGSFNDQLQPSYSANDYNTLRVGKFHDPQLTHPMLNNLSFLPKQPSHSLTDSYLTPLHYHDHATQNQMESKPEFYEEKGAVSRNCFDYLHPITDENKKPFDLQTYPAAKQLNPHISKPMDYASVTSDVNHVMGTFMPEHGHTHQAYPPIPPQPFFPVASHVMGTSVQDYEHASEPHPPILPKPLFPIQTEPSSSSLQVTSSATTNISAVSPVGTTTTIRRQIPVYGSKSLLQREFYNESPMQGSTFIHQPSSSAVERKPSIQERPSFKEKPAYCDAALLFKQPHRMSRPDRIVIILRGLPGSGKSYLAKAIRDIEVENGGSAPRIHAMDDYFMIEVEKVEDSEGFKLSGSTRSKKINKKVIEYCYEPEMEEAYRSSMLKAFKKTLDDGVFTFVIVDDRNLRVADFAQFWAIAKRSGFEVYLLEATYKDPTGCAARNIHGFKLADIQKMSEQWEEASPLYLHLDTQSLFGGDDMIDNSIQEVDMEADDTVGDGEAQHLQETEDSDSNELISLLYQESNFGSTKLGRRWDAEEEEDDDSKASSVPPKNGLPKKPKSTVADAAGALSGLIQAYGKCVKYVRWGDKIETTGFSIGANRSRHCESSLIIGPGPGYDLKSNPLPEEDNAAASDRGRRAGSQEETKRKFDEQLRAERESFRAVFDRRRQRLAGVHFLQLDDD